MVQSNGKKKLFLYFIIFILLSTISNKSINNQDISFFVISNINVSGLSSKNNLKVKNDLSKILLKNIFLINKDSFIKILSKNNLIESFKIKKIYPNSIEIDLKETNLVFPVARLANLRAASLASVPELTTYKQFKLLGKKVANFWANLF